MKDIAFKTLRTIRKMTSKTTQQKRLYTILLWVLFVCYSTISLAQNSEIISGDSIKLWKWFPKEPRELNKGRFYFYWGYNRSKFTKSTIHFSSPTYDFTLFDVLADDRPSPFSFDQYFNPTKATIPQYNYRLGYRITNNWGVSGGIDHMKYVVRQGQEVRISGVISEEISPQYAGAFLNETITITPDFLEYEHSDGLNLVTLDFEYLFHLLESPDTKFKLKMNTGIGGIWVVTKTRVNVLGEGIDNDFHVAGFAMAGKIGPRMELWNRFFISSEFKTGYMTVPDVLIENAAPKKADQTIIFFEYYAAIGALFRFGKKRNKG